MFIISQCIAEFQASHARVVEKLHELKDCSDRYRDAPSSTVGSGEVFCETERNVDAVDGQGVGSTGGGEGPSGQGSSSAAWTQSDNVDGLTVGTMTEEELKEKHDKVCMILDVINLLRDEEKRLKLEYDT